MDFFRRRPLALAGFLFLVSSLFGFFLYGVPKLILAGAVLMPLAGYAVYVLVSRRTYLFRSVLRLALILVPVTVAMLSSYFYFDLYCDCTEAKYAGTPCVIEATVTGRSGGAFGVSYELVATRINGEDVCIPIRLRMDGACPAVVGDGLTVRATPEAIRSFADDRTALCSYISDGYLLGVTVDGEHDTDVTVSGTGTDRAQLPVSVRARLLFSEVRNHLSLYLSDAVGGDEGELASAILLGDRSRVPESVKRDFRRTGASHLLALSGLHVALLSAMAEWVLRRFRIPKRPRVTLLGILMLLYLALVGFLPSAVRAVFMLLVTYLSYLFAEDHDTPTALFFACSLILLLSPASVCDLSFWMSFAATFGIVALYAPMERLIRERRKNGAKAEKRPVVAALRRFGIGIVTSVAVSVAASVAISVPLCLISDEMPLLSPLVTWLLVPAVTVLLILAILTLLCAYIPLFSAFFPDLLHVVGKYMLFVTSRLSRLSGITVSLTHPAVPYVLAGMTICLLVMLFLRFRHKWLIVLPPVAAALVIAVTIGVSSYAERGVIRMTYLQMGSNSEQLIFTGDEGAVIVDFSDGFFSRFRVSAKVVSRAGYPEIRAVVLTHYHQAHTSGVTSLMNSTYVRELWLPYPETERDYAVMNRLVRDAYRSGVSVRLYRNGEEMTWFSDCHAVISKGRIKRSAQETFLMTLSSGNKSLVYFGGAVQESSLAPAAEAAARAGDIVLFGVHGPLIGKIPFRAESVLGHAETILFANDAVLSMVSFDSCPKEENTSSGLLKNVRVWSGIFRPGEHQAD